METQSPQGSAIKSWLLATRPKTLVATLVPVLCGTVVARLGQESLNWWLFFWALLSTLCLQIATNFINDAMDFKKGSDTDKRIGPTRVSSSGLIHPDAVNRAGLAFLALAFAFGVPLIIAGGWPILVIGLVSIVASYSYTGGPYPLAYQGLGDVFVLVFFGWLAVCGSFYLQTGHFDISSFILGTQLGFLATALIAINNLRDIDEDSIHDKRTFAVIFGKKAARLEITMVLLLPFGALAYWIHYYGVYFALPVLALPLAWAIVRNVARNEPSAFYNKFLAQTALVNLIFALTFVFAVLRSRPA